MASEVQPRWVRPTLIGIVTGLLVLSVLIDGRASADEDAPLAARLAAIGCIGLLWTLELVGVRMPRVVLVTGVAIPVAYLNVVREGAVATLFLPLAVGRVTYTGSDRAGRLALGIALVSCASYLLVTDPEGWLSLSVGTVLTWVSVHGLVRQRGLLAEQARLLSELRAAEADLAREARAAERRRIAREIHDVAAHTLAVTMLQLTGVRMLLQRNGGDPQAVEALEQAERLGRQGLDDVRRTVGLLRADDTASDHNTPLPGGADVAALVQQYRAAGLGIDFALQGDAAALTGGTGLALYRIVQEALANVVKHAPGASVRIELLIDCDVQLRVRNSPGSANAPRIAGGSSGLGIAGMRERAELLGGTLTAHACDGGGWVVECMLPR
jgi:signal transduction histidine kinase